MSVIVEDLQEYSISISGDTIFSIMKRPDLCKDSYYREEHVVETYKR